MPNTSLILGSKPGAIIPPADVVYAANASASLYKSEIGKNTHLKVVASAYELFHTDGRPKRRLAGVIDSDPNELIVTAERRLIPYLQHLKGTLPQTTLILLSPQKKRSIFKEIAPLRFPALSVSAYTRSPTRAVATTASLLKNLFIQRFWDPDREVPGCFRPSTGAFTLAYALNEAQPLTTHIVAGIGLSGRTLASQEPDHNGSSENRAFEPHILADRLFFSAIAQEYTLYSTDPAFSSDTGATLISYHSNQ